MHLTEQAGLRSEANNEPAIGSGHQALKHRGSNQEYEGESNDEGKYLMRNLSTSGFARKRLLSTPRIRGFFPETLLWQPELTTDKQGRAQLDFKLADNITTRKMAVIGSTEDGEIGTAATEIRDFQPFFAELDPPRVFNAGRPDLTRRLSCEITWARPRT